MKSRVPHLLDCQRNGVKPHAWEVRERFGSLSGSSVSRTQRFPCRSMGLERRVRRRGCRAHCSLISLASRSRRFACAENSGVDGCNFCVSKAKRARCSHNSVMRHSLTLRFSSTFFIFRQRRRSLCSLIIYDLVSRHGPGQQRTLALATPMFD